MKIDDKPKAKRGRPPKLPPKPQRGGKREGAGRKKRPFDEKHHLQVIQLAGLGLPLYQIAAIVGDGMTVNTLKKNFAHELEVGQAQANTAVLQTLWKKAVGGCTQSLIFWAKSRCGFNPVNTVEISGGMSEQQQEDTIAEILREIDSRAQSREEQRMEDKTITIDAPSAGSSLITINHDLNVFDDDGAI